ncbi:MAG: hypothetical protein CMA63_06550 [Euryarchaeota archaeon]|nr:hypothetical protein [Euryarchaeota archaeon]|tara:strand:+ start:16610 stop:17083 length:474 start_codon:yes stop_codon:yes gene_type:complete
MGIQTEVPERGTYEHVLIRKDRDASVERGVPMRFVCYGENTVSRSVEWQGNRVHTIFLRDHVSAKRAWRKGWIDITDPWFAMLDDQICEPTSIPQQAIFEALDDKEWKSKAEIVKQAQIKDSEWRTAIRTLIEKDLVKVTGATNRSYRYRRTDVIDG